jgi:hypothetical protein
MLSFLEVVAQAASHSTFSCDKIAGTKSRLLAGDSAFGGRQLRQGGCNGARPFAVAPWKLRFQNRVGF